MTGNSWCGSLVLFGLWCKFFAHCHVFPLNNLDRHPYLCVSDLLSCCQHLLDLPVECDRPKVAPTHTCAIHQNHWCQHAIRYGWQSFLRIHRLIRCSEEEHVEWLPQGNRQVQPHDEDPGSQSRKVNHFVPPRFYCVETICAPCGTPDVRPDYVCIDKGCQVLCTCYQQWIMECLERDNSIHSWFISLYQPSYQWLSLS